MQRYKLIIVVVVLIFLSACKTDKDIWQVDLEIENPKGRSLALYEIDAEHGEVFIDSIILKTQGFNIIAKANIKYKSEFLGLFVIKTENNNLICILPENGEHFIIKAKYDSLASTFEVIDETGLGSTYKIMAFQKKLYRYNRLINDMSLFYMDNIYLDNADSLYEAITVKIEDNLEELRDIGEGLVRDNVESLIPVYIVNQAYGARMLFTPNDREDLDSIASWAKKMQLHLAENPHTIRLNTNVERLKNMEKLRFK